MYKELFFVTFDEEAAKLAGVPVGGINLVLMLLTAVTVSVASRIVGAAYDFVTSCYTCCGGNDDCEKL